ncbi:unnamed protein product [Trichobilharzia szidati]|nr:unnamed protein product [Trichobilharzia szidati]CAH8863721.1 unnamed protein product [Trichobilharzia szidati]
MDHETDQSVQNSLVDGVPNYAQPDPMKHREKSMAKQDNGEQKGETVNIKKINPPENGQFQNNSDGEVNGAYNFWDLSDSEIRLLDRRSQMDTSRKYWPHYFSSDYLYPGETNFEPTNWDWLRLNALGPGWEEVLKDVPVTRREALNLLGGILMTQSGLEKGACKQPKTVGQKSRLQAEYKTQSLDLEKAQEQASRVPLLEKTVKQQEDLICRLETFLDRQRKHVVNANLSNYTCPIMNPLDNEVLEPIGNHKPIDNSLIPSQNDELSTSTALRNLSSENDALRRTVAELNRTVRNLARQQQDSHDYQQSIEQRYREEIDALKEQQNRLLEETLHKNRRLEHMENENFRTAIADNERLELYKMLDNSELRIKALEEELQRQRNPKSHLPREPAWKYSGPKKIHQSLPQLNKRNGPNNLVSVNTHKQSPITDLNMHFASHNNKGLNRVLNKRQIHMNNHIHSNNINTTNNNDNSVNHINESNESNAFDYSVNREEEDF